MVRALHSEVGVPEMFRDSQNTNFSSLFPQACNPNACRASGRGLQPKGVRVKEAADFKVFTKGAGSGDLKVMVKGPSEYQGTRLGCLGQGAN